MGHHAACSSTVFELQVSGNHESDHRAIHDHDIHGYALATHDLS